MAATHVTQLPLVIGATGSPGLYSGAADPTAGAGVAAVLGSLYLRTNGTAYWKSGAADTAWTAIGSGGGGQSSELWAPRTTPHAADDEFTGNALNAAWSQTGFTALNFGTRPAPYVNPVVNAASWENLRGPDNASADGLAANTWLRIQPTAGLAGLWKRLDTAAFGGSVPAALTVWARVRFAWNNAVAPAAGDFDIGLSLFDEAGAGFSFATHATVNMCNTQEGVVANVIKPLFWGRNGGAISNLSEGERWNIAATNRNQQTFFSGYLCLQKKDATHYTAWVIDDGGRLYMGEYVDAGLSTIDSVALWCRTNSLAAGGCMFDIDFIRFYQNSDWVP